MFNTQNMSIIHLYLRMAFWYRLRHLKHRMSRYFLKSIVFSTDFGWIPYHLGESSKQTALLEARLASTPLHSKAYEIWWNHKLLCFWFLKIDYWLPKAQPALLQGFALGRLLASPRAAFADPTLGKIPATTFSLTDAKEQLGQQSEIFSKGFDITFTCSWMLLAWHQVGILGFLQSSVCLIVPELVPIQSIEENLGIFCDNGLILQEANLRVSPAKQWVKADSAEQPADPLDVPNIYGINQSNRT